MTPSPAQHLIEHARDCLRRVTEVPVAKEAAREAAAEIERRWKQAPLISAVIGQSIPGRTAFLNHLAGDHWLSESRREWPGALLMLRRGATTSYEVRRQGGVREEYSLEDADPFLVPAGGGKSWSDELRAEVARRERGLERAHSALPGPLRHRPPLWAVWLWIARWLLMIVAKGKRVAFATSATQLGEARARLEAAEKSAAAAAHSSSERRRRFVKEVHSLTNGDGGPGISRLVVEVAEAPLPPGVAVIDLAGGVTSAPKDCEVDAFVLVCEAGRPLEEAASAMADEAEAIGSHLYVVTEGGEPPAAMRPGTLRCLGGFADAAASIRSILPNERALRLARRAAGPLDRAIAALDEQVENAEASFAERISMLEARRIEDPGRFQREQLHRVRPLISQRVHLLIEQATMEISSALERSTQEWLEALDAATSMDDLRQAVARVDEESPESIQSARDHCRRLARASLSAAARDLYEELMRDFRDLAPLSPDQGAPAPNEVSLMPSLDAEETGTRLKGPGSRLTSLFRSLDRVKSEVRGRLNERMTRLRKLGTAELLGAEQPLYQALETPLATTLEAALKAHAARLAESLTREQDAIAVERAELAPLRELRARLGGDKRRLHELLAQAEATLPS